MAPNLDTRLGRLERRLPVTTVECEIWTETTAGAFQNDLSGEVVDAEVLAQRKGKRFIIVHMPPEC